MRHLCAALDVSCSGYYAAAKSNELPRSSSSTALIVRIQEIHSKHRQAYGSRRMTAALQKQGYRCSRHRVRRLMSQAGCTARQRRRYIVTTQSDHRLACRNHLDRQFTVKKLNQVWTSDITYIQTKNGVLYLAVVMDLCSRKILGLAMRQDMTANLVCQALMEAISLRTEHVNGKRLLCHSDQGVQYSSQQYRKLLKQHGIKQSMSRKGNCWDNAPMESFFKTLKSETKKVFDSIEEARSALFEYIQCYYNRNRIHSSLNYQTPDFIEDQLTKTPANHTQ